MAQTSIGLLDTFGAWVTDFNKVGSDVGDIIQLTTPDKSSLVNAINSIGSSVANDTSTNSDFFVVFTDQTSGVEQTFTVANSKLYFNPSTGTLNSTDFNSLSDKNKKDNIESLVDAVNVINNINPVSFTWKDNGNKAYGVIAQDVEEILPDIVSTNKEGVKSVSYTQIIPFLIQVIQEQHKEIQKIKAVVDLD
jgi:hypothetical protein